MMNANRRTGAWLLSAVRRRADCCGRRTSAPLRGTASLSASGRPVQPAVRLPPTVSVADGASRRFRSGRTCRTHSTARNSCRRHQPRWPCRGGDLSVRRVDRRFSAQPFASDAKDAAPSNDASPSNETRRTGKAIVTREDIKQEEKKQGRLSDVLISEVLKAKHSFRWVDPVVRRDATVQEVIPTVIDGGLSGMMVVEEASPSSDTDRSVPKQARKVVGLLTSRDLLRILASGIKDGDSLDRIFATPVSSFMTPISQVIYGRPDETIGMCRTIMAKLGIKCLPILSKNGQVEGLITARDMSDYGLSATDKGGKKSYLHNVSERVGLSSNTSMADPPTFLQAHLGMEQAPLFVNIGVDELPHPFKSHDRVSANHRDFGPKDHADDPELSEDAFFVTTAKLPDEKDGNIREVTYCGVADGVGSWREYDVDPKEFSHKLMEECANIIEEASMVHHEPNTNGSKFRRVVAPSQVLAQAYERVKAENIVGSSTACIALFDNIRHQLHFSNLGDSGIIVLRHIDSDIAGSLKRNKTTPRTERQSDLRVAFVSQQQLKSFNHPYQLGWTGQEIEGESTSFRSARDSCNSSIHLRRGDIIIMATDGLFDNVDTEDIASIALEWEQDNGFIRGGDIAARERRWQMGNSLTILSAERVGDLAQRLVKKARENSLDPTVDSPFAVLAKENDIMWSGGMPDDCTVIVMHVVGRSAKDVMDKDHL